MDKQEGDLQEGGLQEGEAGVDNLQMIQKLNPKLAILLEVVRVKGQEEVTVREAMQEEGTLRINRQSPTPPNKSRHKLRLEVVMAVGQGEGAAGVEVIVGPGDLSKSRD